jgi:hypothetical protein
MSIDGIGKKGGTVPLAPPTTSPTTGAKGEFTLRETEAVGKTESTGAAAEVRAGRMSMDAYLDVRVNEATAHLTELAPSDLKMVKEVLKDQLKNDPALADLVKSATGALPDAD